MGAACAHVVVMHAAPDDIAELDQDACYRAVTTRDGRFDGRFFGAVKTTGIYCRPVCPARTPLRRNMIFYPSAAAAEQAGYRACLRCRPETAPDFASWRAVSDGTGSGAWRGTANTVSRALAMIEAGALDEADVETLAGRLGMGERQLRRLFRQHLGAAPVSVAQTRRVLLAKTLIHDTALSMTQVAAASGFGSVRRFNETFQTLYGRPPSTLRRGGSQSGAGAIRLRLPYRAPYDWQGQLARLAGRGDRIADGVWRRDLTPGVDGTTGWVAVGHTGKHALSVEIDLADLAVLPRVLARIRRVFDLSADPVAIGRDLSADPLLAPLVAARPGLRLTGDWIDDGVEAPSDRLTTDVPAPDLTTRAEGWRPWRAYAALHLTLARNEPEMNDDRHAA